MNKQLSFYIYFVLLAHLAVLATGWQHMLNGGDSKLIKTISIGDPSVTLKLGSHTIIGVDKIKEMGQRSQKKMDKVVKDKFALPNPEADKKLAKDTPEKSASEGRPGQLSQLGGGEGIGAGGIAGTGTLTGMAQADLRTIFHTELRARIEANKSYPPMSRRLGHTGLVVVAFTLLEDGSIINLRVDKPSPYDRLNDSALDAVKKVQKFKPIPKELGESKMDIKIPVKFVTI